MPSTITHTIKPGGGGDYTSIEAWKSAQSRNLVAADEIAQAELYSGGNVSANPGFRFDIASFVTDDTRYVDWVVPSGERHQGVYDTSYAYMEKTITGNTGYYTPDKHNWTGLQYFMNSASTLVYGARWDYTAAANYTTTVDSCIIRAKHVSNSNPGAVEVRASGSNSFTVVYKNCILTKEPGSGVKSGRVALMLGFSATYTCTLNMYNNTLVWTDTSLTGGTHNSLVSYYANGFLVSENNYHGLPGVGTDDTYLAISGGNLTEGTYDAGTYTDVAIPSIPYSTSTFVSVTSGSEDFTLASGSGLIDVGTDLSGSGVTTDIVGTARPVGSAYDVGAFEDNSGDKTFADTFAGHGELGITVAVELHESASLAGHGELAIATQVDAPQAPSFGGSGALSITTSLSGLTTETTAGCWGRYKIKNPTKLGEIALRKLGSRRDRDR